MEIRADILVRGRVQGVGFRYFTVNEARALDLTGTVTNLLNGDVKVIVEGEKSAVLTLVKNLRIGPRFASVSDVLTEFTPCKNEFNNFHII